ncbi:hypothetical protein [Eikenella corrodens]|nr:hypothetical protein [Eikenella corrodens]
MASTYLNWQAASAAFKSSGSLQPSFKRLPENFQVAFLALHPINPR